MRKQKSVTIEGHAYELSQLGGVQGRELVILFGQLLGRLAPFVASSKTLDEEAVLAISQALSSIRPEQLEPLWEAFGRNAWVKAKDGKGRELVHDVFDEHFAGEYFAMILFFIESSKLNFGDFLGKALATASASHDTAPTP